MVKMATRNNMAKHVSMVKNRKRKTHRKTIRKSKKTIKKTNTKSAPQLTKKQIEFLLLLNTLIIYTMDLKNHNTPDKKIKNKLETLLKAIRRNDKFIPNTSSDNQIRIITETIYNIAVYIPTNTLEIQRDHKGGFFFKNIEDKADQPITGADITRLLDEIQQFFYNAQYVEEGQFLRDTNTVLSMLRGDTQQFKTILKYQIFPKYYSPFPPFIKWDAIKEDFFMKDNPKWHDIPDYLLAYQTYLKLRDEYLVEKGVKSPSVLSKDLYTGFFDKAANSLSDNIYKLEQLQRIKSGRFTPISVS
jgi:hypothetical protein